jgi:hypothetical protein
MTNTITILALSTVILSVTFIPLAEASIGWNGFLQEIGFGGPQIYEVTDSFVIPVETEEKDAVHFVSIRCLDGDWMYVGINPHDSSEISSPTPTGGALVFDNEKFIRVDGSSSRIIGIDAAIFLGKSQFGFEITTKIICFSPSPLASPVGGDWRGTDTVALFIGYSVLNAYWLAPTIAGLGAGIYLTKNKWKR